jgi:hypothetical protein
MENTAGRRIGRAGHLALQLDAIRAYIRVCRWNCGKQGLGVWMQWLVQQCFRIGHLNDFAHVHHCDPVRNVFDYR